MYIVSTNESLFDSVFRLLGANKEFEFDEKQSQLDALEQELNSYEISLYDLTSGIQEAIDQLDDVLGKKRISHEAIKNIRDMLVRMT